MKMPCLKLLSMILILLMVLTSCGTAGVQGDSDTIDTVEAVATDAEATDEITTEEVIMNETTTEVVTTDTATTEAATTEAPVEKKQIKNILMIGNSACSYYVQEFCGIASADGYEINLANLYKSGGQLYKHYYSYLNDTRIAKLYLTTSKRRREVASFSFKEALEYANKYLGGDWDVISLQGGGMNSLLGDKKKDEQENFKYATELYNYIRENHPDVTLYWHQTWAYELGYGKDKGEAYQMNDVEHQKNMYQIKKDIAYSVAEQNNVKIGPTGDAWEIARKNELIGTTLCKRLAINNGEGDYYHDGDIGGGQYLNACVWYEVLLGESCVGNTWRPTYELSEEKIAILQQAAHEAVAAVYGADYAK